MFSRMMRVGGDISTAIGDIASRTATRHNAMVNTMRGPNVFNLPSSSIRSFLLSKAYKLFQAPSHLSQALPLIKITLHLVQR